jgi:hypothetical protein
MKTLQHFIPEGGEHAGRLASAREVAQLRPVPTIHQVTNGAAHLRRKTRADSACPLARAGRGAEARGRRRLCAPLSLAFRAGCGSRGRMVPNAHDRALRAACSWRAVGLFAPGRRDSARVLVGRRRHGWCRRLGWYVGCWRDFWNWSRGQFGYVVRRVGHGRSGRRVRWSSWQRRGHEWCGCRRNARSRHGRHGWLGCGHERRVGCRHRRKS